MHVWSRYDAVSSAAVFLFIYFNLVGVLKKDLYSNIVDCHKKYKDFSVKRFASQFRPCPHPNIFRYCRLFLAVLAFHPHGKLCFRGPKTFLKTPSQSEKNRFSILALSCGRQKLEGGQNDDVTTPSLSGVQGTAWLTVLNSLSWAFLSWLLWLHPHLVGNVLVGKTFQPSCTAPCRASGKASQGTGNAPATILFISVWGQKIYLKTGQRSDVKCSKHISSSYRYQHVAWLEKDDVQKCLHGTSLFFSLCGSRIGLLSTKG